MKKIICVADWASDSYANQEFRTAVEGFAKTPQDVSLSFVASTPSTIHTGFIINQMCLTEERLGRPAETIIFQNTDPRLQSFQGVEAAEGAPFVIARLACGIYVCGPNAGFNFSFVISQIEELFTYPGVEKGSQFRSRDLFARIVTHLADYMEEELQLEEAHLALIPGIEKDTYHIGHIDNHGNIKTTMTLDDLREKHEIGEYVRVTINKGTKDARFVSNMFAGHPGELVVFPGSSGHVENPYLEISVWRHFEKGEAHTGLREFNFPRPGDVITIK